MADSYCEQLSSPNIWILALAVFLVAGILGSYLPQHAKIIRKQSSAGLSPWWVLLGTLSSIAGLTNIIVLPSSQHDMACCRKISPSACGAAMLGIIQVGVQWTCFMAIMVLFLAFFPRQSDVEQSRVLAEEDSAALPKPRDAVIVAAGCLIATLVAGLGSLFYIVMSPKHLLGWANTLGVIASVLACVQYIPQIWTTYRLGRVLSLSILTMLIQVPGSFLFSFSLYLRVGLQGWSTWLVYCVTGLLQGCLLVLAVYFWYKDKKAQQDQDQTLRRNTYDERTPLLPPHVVDQSRPQNSSTLRTINGTVKKHSIDLLYRATPPDQSSLPSDSED